MAKFASGKHALAVCDVCGQTVRYVELRPVYVDRRRTGTLSCQSCWDEDHPQLQAGKRVRADAEGLEHARPDSNVGEARDIQWGWAPVGGGFGVLTPNTLVLISTIGAYEVRT